MTTLWMHNADADSDVGCGSCATGITTPACQVPATGARCDRPALSGDNALLDRILGFLRDVPDPLRQSNVVDAGLIRALRIDRNEAELALTFAPSCGSHQKVADQAFQVLRRALPDTDVYVVHAPA